MATASSRWSLCCVLLSLALASASLTAVMAREALSPVPSSDDCALRLFVTEYVALLQPADSRTRDWAELAAAALELSRCNSSVAETGARGRDEQLDASEHFAQLFPDRARLVNPSLAEAPQCSWSVYVDGTNGDDSNPGTVKSPFKSIHHALSASRSRNRLQLPTACITVREGTYYLGGLATSYSPRDSSSGVIALTSADSGLTLQAHPDERVVLSGGVPLRLQWQRYRGDVLQAALPADIPAVDRWHLNELYVDGRRAVRAKYPNGDPASHGLWNKQGWIDSAASWQNERHWPPATEIRVATPSFPNTSFPVYTMGVGGSAAAQFDPPESFWETSYNVPTGLTAASDLSGRLGNWSDPSTGQVFAFHAGHWGSWVFDIASVDASNASAGVITFGRGGFQEARGSGSGAEFYVSGILQELDDALEWFLDAETRTLYFQPNGSAPGLVVASQVPCILSIHGTKDAAASGITIRGFTFTHTANTFMREYRVPSGGDWSIHAGGAVFAEGTEFLLLHDNRFVQLGGNAVVLQDYHTAAHIDTNEFAWLGESGVVLLGQSSGIDGVSNLQQPTLTAITRNLFHEGGAYVKQSAPIVQFLSRSTRIIHNVIFNAPRAGININDQFAGDVLIAGNAIFNMVRETSDHGPINTWNRLPYLTGSPPSLVPLPSNITRNLLMNSYNCVWPLDHDDGSAYWRDSFNVLLYGGAKNFLGHSKVAHDTLYIFPDGQRYDPSTAAATPRLANRARADRGDAQVAAYWGTYCMELDSPAWGEQYYNNLCAMQRSGEVYGFSGCNVAGNLSSAIPWTYNNTFLLPAGVAPFFSCNNGSAGRTWNLTEWQQSTGYDQGSIVAALPPVQQLIGIGRQMLGLGSRTLFHSSLRTVTSCVSSGSDATGSCTVQAAAANNRIGGVALS